jgi:cytoskeletal protein RodZ
VVDLDDDIPCDPATFGEQLRRTREGAGLRVSDIAEETKVSKGILRALEDGRFERLPERVFCRSFVAQYARTVGADEKPLLIAFDQAWEGYRASSGTHPNLEVVSDDLGPSIRWGFWIPITAGILILLVAAAVILRGSTFMGEDLAPDPRRSGAKQVTQARATQMSAKPTPRMQPPEAADDLAEESVVNMAITVGAGEESWIHYRDREGMTGQSLLTNGDRLDLELAGPVKLTVGNAGAVKIVVGNQVFSDLGLPGQVIHTEVTREGFSRLGRGEAQKP